MRPFKSISPPKGFITVQAAAKDRCSTETIRRMCWAGKVKHRQHNGRLCVLEKEITEWWDARN